MKRLLISLFLGFSVLLFSETTISVLPINKQQSAGIYVRKGESIKIDVSGKWSLWDKYAPVGGEGHPFVANDYGNWGTLLGKIGNGEIFVIGKGKEVKSTSEGILYLFPNKGKYLIENASGNLSVSVLGGVSIEDFTAGLVTRGTKIEFDPKQGFYNTKLFVREGATLEIYAIGYWTMWDGVYPEVSAEGHEFAPNGMPWGKLLGGIGSTFGLNLEEFQIGEKTIYKAQKSGILTFYPYISNYVAVKNGKLDIYVIGASEAGEFDLTNSDKEVRKYFETNAVNKLNAYRKEMGLPEFQINESLSNAAFGHSLYIANNNFTRDQSPDMPFFTGVTLEDRLKSSGFLGKAREMFCQTDNSDDPVDLFFNSVYHRLRLMNPEIKTVGYASSKNKNDDLIHVFNFGYIEEGETVAEWEAYKYPNDGSTNVNPVWSGIENPDPLPSGTVKPLGIPVSILFKNQIKSIIKAELRDSEGNLVECISISPDNDPNKKQINSITLVPKMMLNNNSKYSVSISVELGTDGAIKDYNWTFETGEAR